MPGRSNPDNRCSICQMYQPLCLCSEIPKIKVNTKILILMHWRERKLSTNTANLAKLALPNSEIHLRGELNQPLQVEKLIQEGASAALLYPTEDAIELNVDLIQRFPKPLTLIVPDGSWRQAKKVAIRENALKTIPRLKLPVGEPSSYRLRHSTQKGNLCTFEAIARALGILEGKEVQESLERVFLMMVERKLWSRGTLKEANCTTEIPPEAILASHQAGVRG